MPLPHFSALSPRVSRSSVSAAFSCAAQRLSASGTPRATPLSASTSRTLLAPPAANTRVDPATAVLPPSFPHTSARPLDRAFRKSRAFTGNSAKLPSGILTPPSNASAFSASSRAVPARAQMASAAVGDAESVPEIKGRVEANGVAVLTMDRPKALNAMNLGMDRAYKALLDQWAVDPRVKAVLVEGSTPRAFSAGGDVKAIVTSNREELGMEETAVQVFTAEYTLICAIARYPKPYIALMDGVTMGFGLGLSAHGRYRVVTERALMAMPENAIGLFPDVGFARIAALTPAGGALGTYMGMTGARISTPNDALLAGLATHYVPSAALPNLKQDLLQAEFASDASSLVETILSRHAQPTSAAAAAAGGEGAGVAAGSQIEAVLPAIERCFHRSQCPTVPHVLAALRAEEQSADSTVSQWARDSLQAMAAGAPLSLAVTLKHFHALSTRAAHAAATAPNQAQAAKLLPIEDVMRTEYRMALRTSVRPDFLEGVRAVLIDKDKNPKWSPATQEEVDESEVEAAFAPFTNPSDELAV